MPPWARIGEQMRSAWMCRHSPKIETIQARFVVADALNFSHTGEMFDVVVGRRLFHVFEKPE
jgi:ubiquinone/menaquinone biosynthesis C-methylase UbiE